MKEAQTVTYDGEGNITKIVEGIGKNQVIKKSKYMKKVEEEEKLKEIKRQEAKEKREQEKKAKEEAEKEESKE